jgi:hypothetical protein
MSGFFEELKRRKVYRVAVAYILAGGIIIQIASARPQDDHTVGDLPSTGYQPF